MITKLERSSVCMGDDCMAPNRGFVDIPDTACLADLIGKIKEIKYLPNVYGGIATWVLYHHTNPLAVVAQQCKDARYLLDKEITLRDLFVNVEMIELEFIYRQQVDPSEVFEK